MTAHDPAPATTLPVLVRTAAATHGGRDYVVSPSGRLTFGDADVRSGILAKHLLAHGVSKGAHVGMWFPQGPDFVVVLLAITRIGAIAVPLSTFLTGPELRTAVSHADVHTMIAPGRLLGSDSCERLQAAWPELESTSGNELLLSVAPHLRQVWVIGDGRRRWARSLPDLDVLEHPPEISDDLLAEAESAVHASDPMVMIFTSGATAEPKAVVHTHGAQLRHSANLAQLYDFDTEVRTFTTMPFFWVGGLTVTLLTHLHVGAMVITVESLHGPTIVEIVEKTSPTRLVGWGLIERLHDDPSVNRDDLRALEQLQPPAQRHPGRRHGSLGMTETSGPHTLAPSRDNTTELPSHLQGSFGPAVPGVEHRIIDPESGTTLPDGVEGEICVRGASLMDGIYKRERADTFDPDGWYHTGDRGSFRDGYLFFTGRITEMIKTDGANVAPAEVEAAVTELPGVRAAYVVGLPDDGRGQLVGCVVCPEPGAALDIDTLTDSLRSRLSSYKVPKRIMAIAYEDLPWLPSGKLSKPRLVDLLVGGA